VPKTTTAACRAERDELLAALERSVPGFGERWEEWRGSLPSRKRWTLLGELLKLRRFARSIVPAHRPAEVLDMLVTAADRQWQGFELHWWEQAVRDRSEACLPPFERQIAAHERRRERYQ
jgi:hypothetical protein